MENLKQNPKSNIGSIGRRLLSIDKDKLKKLKLCRIYYFIRSNYNITIHDWYRNDCNMWEEKKKIFWFINYYKYSIWKQGKTHVHIKLNKYPNPIYQKKPYETKIYVGKKEFKETYKSNKWIIPINKELNLELP